MTPTIGDKLIINLKTKDLMLAQQKAADLGYLETANRVKQHVTSIMRYAVQKGVIESNPAHDLKDSIKTQKTQHFPALSLELLPEFWRRLDLYSKGLARKTTIIALKLFMYIFVRSSELRLGRWPEIDFDSKMKMWLIPDNREPIDGVRYSYRGAKMSGYFVPFLCPLFIIINSIQARNRLE